MRYIIYGAGGIGGVVGGRLFQHGHEVVLIARGKHLDVLRERGLELQSPDERVVLPIPAVGSPAELEPRPGDAILLCMKTQDTGPALEAALAAYGDAVPIVCLQNGVENERMALRRFRRVYATSVMLPATHLEPGVVQANSATTTGILDTGCYPAGADAFCEQFTADLERSNFSAKPDPLIMRKKYRKLLMNLSNAIQAALGADAQGAGLGRRAREEGERCYQAAGIDYASEAEDRERRGTLVRIEPIGGQLRGGGSTWQSLARGAARTEADYLNGEIVLLGRMHGVATPVNATLQRVANRLAAAGAAPGSMTLEALEAEIAAAAGAK